MAASLASRAGESQTKAISRRQNDFASRPGQSLRSVLDKIEKRLNEQVAIAVNRRQRGVVFLDEPNMPGEAGLRGLPNPPKNFMDVDRLALDRPIVGE